MEHPSDPRCFSRDQKCVGAAERNVSPHTRRRTKLRDILMSDKPNLSYADFHHKLTRDPDDATSKCLGSQKSQILGGVIPKEDELVRYMSNLPSYLEKGNNFPDKALNFGVLDWKRLEKWQYRQKQMAQKHNGCSPSSSNTTVFSTVGSSTHSSRGQSCSPAHKGMHRSSLQSPQESSPKEGNIQDATSSSNRGHGCSPAHQVMHNAVLQSCPLKVYDRGRKSQEIDVFGGNSGNFEDSPVSTVNHMSRQQKVLAAPQQCERKESDRKSVSEPEQCPIFNKNEVPEPWKGKTKILGSESTKPQLKEETKGKVADQDYFKRERSGLLISPIDQSENRCSGVVSSALTVNGQLSINAERKSISGKNEVECSLPHKIDNKKHFEPTGSCSQNPESIKDSFHASHISSHSTKMFHSPSRISAQGVNSPSQAPQKLSYPVRTLTSPSRSRNTEGKPVAGIGGASSGKPFEDLYVRKSFESVSKARNSSPIRILSFAMGKMTKNAGSRDSSPLCRSSSKDCVAKSGSEEAIASSSIDIPGCNQSSSNNIRGRSSPLRRLLDPLLKPRASNGSELSKKHPSSTVGTINSSCKDQSDICAGHSVKIQSRSANVSDSIHNSKNGSSSLQALLQVSFKNGFPLFTFATDNESNILAATVRKSFVPGKGHHNWTYTFFTVHEIKRKSGIWLNHGGKGDGHGYVPNVVAQMKVSDSRDSPFTKQENADDHITREFDLFEVDVGNGDNYATDFHPTNELAAIVVKLPRISSGNASKDGQSSYSWLDLSQVFRGNLQETKSFAGADDDLQYHHFLRSLNLSTTVVLPGGVHTVPSKGEISTLAQRWRSGGSCDCGGWDLGCQLRVYTNQREYNRKIGSCLGEDKFQLFSQVGQDDETMLSLAPFKERIYSVEFKSSLSLLQTFAICISFIDCRRPAELADPSYAFEKINSEIGIFEVPIPMKTSNHQVGAPARYISYPPNSPVGRV